MKKLNVLFLLIGILLLVACGGEKSADGVLVEVISLDHSPIRPTVAEVEAVAAEFGDAVTIQTYNFGTPEGDAFAKEHKLVEHTPIAIYINGEMEYKVADRDVKFYSFPQNAGTGMVAEGVWTMDDLRSVLEQLTQ